MRRQGRSATGTRAIAPRFLCRPACVGLADLLQLIFMAGLASVVARTQGRVGVLTLLAFGGALGGTLMVLLSNAVIATTALVVDSGTEAGVVRSLDALTRMLTTFDDPPWALGYAARCCSFEPCHSG